MATVTAELIDTGEKRDERGRRVTPRERRAEMVEFYRRSGLTQAEFARREGLHYSTFSGWVLRAERAKVRVPAVQFAEVKLPASQPSRASRLLEVRLADGTLVRGESASSVAELVRALRA